MLLALEKAILLFNAARVDCIFTLHLIRSSYLSCSLAVALLECPQGMLTAPAPR